MLILDDKKVLEALSYEAAMQAVEDAILIYDSGDYTMPDRMHMDMGKNTLLLMPCFIQEYFGTKLVSVFPDNPERNLPSVKGTMLLNDASTGTPLAIFGAAGLTALRTGAVGGVAIKYLARPDAATMGLIGIGVQGFQQACFACSARDISNIYILDRDAEKTSSFTARFNLKFPEVKITPCSGASEILEKSEIVITATNSTDPVLPDTPSLLKDKTFIAVGSYKSNMREMPEELFHITDIIYVDTLLSKKESGDVFFPLSKGILSDNQVKTLGYRIANKLPPPGGTKLFKSVGMALFDLITAKMIYEKRLKLMDKSNQTIHLDERPGK